MPLWPTSQFETIRLRFAGILPQPNSNTAICYISRLPPLHEIRALRQQVAQENVLTVGETLDFMRKGGMVQLFVENQKIRFAVNTDAVNQTYLKVSSKLLRLGKIYTP